MVAETPDPTTAPPDGERPVSPQPPGKVADAPAERWHYARSGSATVGPVSIGALREAVASGEIDPDTAVWHPDFGAEWRAAATIPDLLPAWRERERRRVASVSATAVVGTVQPLRAFASAFAFVFGRLFRAFSFLFWLAVALADLMASSRMFSGTGGETALPALAQGARPADLAVAAVTDARDGLAAIFEPRISIVWLATVVIYGFFTSYIAAKGRLLFVAKACFPDEPLPLLWKRGIGRTASLWRFYFLLDVVLNIGFAWLLWRFCRISGLAAAKGPLDFAAVSAAFDTPAALLVSAALALFAAIEFVRTCAFHFIEPVVFTLGIPVSAAARLLRRNLPSALPRFAAFFALVVAVRAAYFSLVLVVATLLPPAILLPVAVLILLPFDFLVRSFGISFIEIKTMQ